MLASGPSEPRLNFSFNETHFLIASPPGKTARRVMRTRASTVNIAESLTERHTGTTALFVECLAADKAYPCDNLFYSHKNRIKLGLSFFKLYSYRKLLSVSSGWEAIPGLPAREALGLLCQGSPFPTGAHCDRLYKGQRGPLHLILNLNQAGVYTIIMYAIKM